jgi:hypothetical protein
MRSRLLFSGAATLLVFAGCGYKGSGSTPQTGGATGTAGQNQSGGSSSDSAGSGGLASSGGITTAGGTTESGSTTNSGGATGGLSLNVAGRASGGIISSGGITSSGGIALSGGQPGSGGTTARGGASASGGTAASGGIAASAGRTGGATGGAAAGTGGTTGGGSYQGPCDLVSGGCAEAYSVVRAMTVGYTGPLFQLGKTSDTKGTGETLDVGQTSDHRADMTTWSAFCGGTQSNCVLSKIYAQIHKGSNDLLPAVWNTPWKPDCSAGGYACAAKFTIEAATGLPIITTVAPQEYALRSGNTESFATGVNGGSKAMGIMYNGKPIANQTYCCGTFGLTHKYNATDTYGTDFMAALAYGWRDSGGCCIAVNCGKANTYCVGAEEEENNDLYDYGTSPVDNAMVVTQFDPNPTATHGTVISYLNGVQVLSHSPPAPLSRGNYPINAGTAIHMGGGGDLSQPAPVLMREGLITNTVMTASEVTAMKANLVAFYSPLKFP